MHSRPRPQDAEEGEVAGEARIPAPRTLLLLGVCFFLTLTAHELFAGGLAITRDRGPA